MVDIWEDLQCRMMMIVCVSTSTVDFPFHFNVTFHPLNRRNKTRRQTAEQKETKVKDKQNKAYGISAKMSLQLKYVNIHLCLILQSVNENWDIIAIAAFPVFSSDCLDQSSSLDPIRCHIYLPCTHSLGLHHYNKFPALQQSASGHA